MQTKCVKPVKKSVEKSAQKTWKQIVDKIEFLQDAKVLNDFYRIWQSFTQLVLTYKKAIFNLLTNKFCTFSTYTTNTTIY